MFGFWSLMCDNFMQSVVACGDRCGNWSLMSVPLAEIKVVEYEYMKTTPSSIIIS